MRCKLAGCWVSPSVGVCERDWPGQRWRLSQLGSHCPSESPPGMPRAAVTQREGEERRVNQRRKQATNNHDNWPPNVIKVGCFGFHNLASRLANTSIIRRHTQCKNKLHDYDLVQTWCSQTSVLCGMASETQGPRCSPTLSMMSIGRSTFLFVRW